MRFAGVNLIAVLVAAIAMYAIGFVLYGVLFEDQWMAWTGTSEEMAQAAMGRMYLSPIMPLLAAFGLATVYRWAGVDGLPRAMKVSVALWLFFAVSILLYGYVYSTMRVEAFALDCAHLLLNYVVGGAIIALWPRGRVRTTA